MGLPIRAYALRADLNFVNENFVLQFFFVSSLRLSYVPEVNEWSQNLARICPFGHMLFEQICAKRICPNGQIW
jgi:hypothetical protein